MSLKNGLIVKFVFGSDAVGCRLFADRICATMMVDGEEVLKDRILQDRDQEIEDRHDVEMKAEGMPAIRAGRADSGVLVFKDRGGRPGLTNISVEATLRDLVKQEGLVVVSARRQQRPQRYSASHDEVKAGRATAGGFIPRTFQHSVVIKLEKGGKSVPGVLELLLEEVKGKVAGRGILFANGEAAPDTLNLTEGLRMLQPGKPCVRYFAHEHRPHGWGFQVVQPPQIAQK